MNDQSIPSADPRYLPAISRHVIARTSSRFRHNERTASSGLADLLAEAMAAYQATQPAERDSWDAEPERVDEQQQASGGSGTPPGVHGRHRSSEWAPADFDSG